MFKYDLHPFGNNDKVKIIIADTCRGRNLCKQPQSEKTKRANNPEMKQWNRTKIYLMNEGTIT